MTRNRWPRPEWTAEQLREEIAWRERPLATYQGTGRGRYISGLRSQIAKLRAALAEKETSEKEGEP
jgi:hypothetical protein